MCLGLLQREEFHTRLALLYLDQVLQLQPPDGSPGAEVPEVQKKLRLLLQRSDLYRVHYLLGEGAPRGGGAGKKGGSENQVVSMGEDHSGLEWGMQLLGKAFCKGLSPMAQHDVCLKLKSLCEFVCVCMDSRLCY